MRHQGVAFPPEYVAQGLEVKIGGTCVKLEPLQEEMLLAWAKKIGTPYVDDPVFQDNFLVSLREQWPERFEGIGIQDIEWTELQRIADREKLASMPEEQRKAVSAERKKKREELKEKYGHAQVDDHTVEIGAYLVEPPGIFMGRGAHPLRGRWKPRVYSWQVTLNLDEEAPTPEAAHTPEGEDAPRWAGRVAEHESLWVARWLEVLTNKVKYVWLAETSHLRQERERAKYDKATQLAENLREVRDAIRKGMRDENEKKRQVATVAYLIDRLAMRVGDEKDEDEADTVGASTLRAEHVVVHPDRIEFDFLGKDSVRWERSLPIENQYDRTLAENITRFKEGKKEGEQLFPDITSARVNDFLRSVMPGLSAKVFRTFHATTTVEQFLYGPGKVSKDASEPRKEYAARMANLQAAITCNHKRTPPKTWAESLRKREESVEKLRRAKPDLGRLDEAIGKRRTALDKARAEQKAFEEAGEGPVKKKREALAALEAKPVPQGEKAVKEHEKRLKRASKSLRETERAYKLKARRLKQRAADAQAALKKAEEARKKAEAGYRERLERAERQLELVRETKDYALNTSLKNYIDPRVYRDWGAKVHFEWEKLYTGSLLKKFTWVTAEENTSGAIQTEENTNQMVEETV